MKTAVLVDGAFFLKRYRALYPDKASEAPDVIVRDLYAGALNLLRKANRAPRFRELYRIFFYDCPPLTKHIQNPVSQRGIRLERSAEAAFRLAFHEELRRQRKVALRLGRLDQVNARWVIKEDVLKRLLRRTITLDSLTEADVVYEARQKGVDMKIAVDIASLAYKKAVDQIILVAGDSDFVPAAKLARREGIDFVLDPMWNKINPDLFEHIDGLCSGWKNPQREQRQNQVPAIVSAG